MEKSEHKFKGEKGMIRAIIMIQSCWRMFMARKTYLRVQALIEKVIII